MRTLDNLVRLAECKVNLSICTSALEAMKSVTTNKDALEKASAAYIDANWGVYYVEELIAGETPMANDANDQRNRCRDTPF